MYSVHANDRQLIYVITTDTASVFTRTQLRKFPPLSFWLLYVLGVTVFLVTARPWADWPVAAEGAQLLVHATTSTFPDTGTAGLVEFLVGDAGDCDGWLRCDGAQVSSIEYPELSRLLRSGHAERFSVPDYRGLRATILSRDLFCGAELCVATARPTAQQLTAYVKTTTTVSTIDLAGRRVVRSVR